MNTKELIRKLEQMTELSESRNEFYKKLIHSFQNDADQQVYDKIYSNLCGLLAHGDLNNKEYDLLKEVLYEFRKGIRIKRMYRNMHLNRHLWRLAAKH